MSGASWRGQRRRIRLSRVALAAAVLACLTATATATAARPAFAAATVATDSITLVSDPGVTLATPSDGRLRGDHLAAAVTGVAFATRIGFGGSARQAARDQRLVVFGLQGPSGPDE